MAGTKAGGLKAAATNKAKYGDDFYKVQGAIGDRNCNTGGFAANPALARIAGARGGKSSKRASVYTDEMILDACQNNDTIQDAANALGLSRSYIYVRMRKIRERAGHRGSDITSPLATLSNDDDITQLIVAA